MPRDLPIGNGNLLISFDKNYLLRELYFPHVGEENQTKGEVFRFGVWTSSHFSWIPDGWRIQREYLEDSLITNAVLENDTMHLRIVCNDGVDFHENLYVKKLFIENLLDEEREVRLFFAQDFHLYGNEIGDTAEFRPEGNCLLHYKSERYFLIGASIGTFPKLDQFATGNKIPGLFEGTWKDAEDGHLGGNPIAQGSVDSVLGIHVQLKPKEKKTCYYWICCGKNWEEVFDLHKMVKKKGGDFFLKRTENYWSFWVNKDPIGKDLLPPKVLNLYKKSLLIARSQINNCGSIIAGTDSDVMQFNKDTYSYVWPRDGALVAHAFDLAGYGGTVEFYNFCNRVIAKDGYLLHKYTPSGSLASSWHPWLKENKPQIPIQEDETALVIWALWKHYEIFKDIEFIKPLYKSLIKRAADFMMNYRDLKTGLPLPSYDLWEERQGVLTFTTATVYGGLLAAANFAEKFGEVDLAKEYRLGASFMKEGMSKYLYLEKEKRFARMVGFNSDESMTIDATIDASLYGVFAFGAYAADDEKVKNTMGQVYAKLWRPHGGLCRYENDSFYQEDRNNGSNPWFVTTLWMAQYYIALAKERQDLQKALDILEWVADRALPSGVLSEQIHPITHEPLSVSPLTWSHGTYIIAVQEYLNKLLQIEKCPTCGQSKLCKHV